MSSVPAPPPLRELEPVWELATLWPAQGTWTESHYLELVNGWTNRRFELADGNLEVLAMPTDNHQDIMVYLFDALRAEVAAKQLGKVQISGIPLRVRPGSMRQPDIVFLRTENKSLNRNEFWEGADLAIEILSADHKSRKRDHVSKVEDYAEARIPEYWIVDPQEKKITVLTLPEGGDAYVEHGVFKPGDQATSKLLDGFAVDVQAVFDAGKE